MWCAAVQSLPFGPDGAGEPAGTGRDVLEIVAEQAALRRVSTLVARGVSHEELFAVVNQELARLAGTVGAEGQGLHCCTPHAGSVALPGAGSRQ